MVEQPQGLLVRPDFAQHQFDFHLPAVQVAVHLRLVLADFLRGLAGDFLGRDGRLPLGQCQVGRRALRGQTPALPHEEPDRAQAEAGPDDAGHDQGPQIGLGRGGEEDWLGDCDEGRHLRIGEPTCAPGVGNTADSAFYNPSGLI